MYLALYTERLAYFVQLGVKTTNYFAVRNYVIPNGFRDRFIKGGDGFDNEPVLPMLTIGTTNAVTDPKSNPCAIRDLNCIYLNTEVKACLKADTSNESFHDTYL
jgi:hypothetical protein